MRARSTSLSPEQTPDLIVGIGASAGGPEALQAFFSAVPASTGLAFIIIQHLDPSAGDLMREWLQPRLALPLVEAQTGQDVQADHVYFAPPRSLLTLQGGQLRVEPIESRDDGRHVPVDVFLQSLAEDQELHAVGILLSGTGTDGSLGLKAIADVGGLTLVQDEQTAKHASMPQNAALFGVVDHVLAPEDMPGELIAYRHYLQEFTLGDRLASFQAEVVEAIPRVARILEKSTENNFQHYKTSTLSRRIQRRMQVLRISNVDAYLEHLSSDEEEVRRLFRELLIGVTAFFRDPEAFETLGRDVLAPLLRSRSADEAVRIWVPGCATGEEAYSIAILIAEQIREMPQPPRVQIFGTDLNERALVVARQGSYPQGIAENVSPARLNQFFTRRGLRFHVHKDIRDMCSFTPHNLISDPPFSRLDLISCRNLLIYLGPHLQQKLIPLFHYALREGGYLFLGPSENLSTHKELFKPVSVKHRISQRRPTAVGTRDLWGTSEGFRRSARLAGPQMVGEPDVHQYAQRILLDEFAPEYAVVNEEYQVVSLSGNASRYLQFSEGEFRNNVIKMARSGLRVGLRSALHEALRVQRKVVHEHLAVRGEQGVQRLRLTVQPMPHLGEDRGLLLIVFQQLETLPPRDEVRISGNSEQADQLIEQLERELTSTREDLEKTVQDLEVSNEELKSSNEELLSMNEELQSANEELESSKEEIQAGNEALSRSNSDLENLLTSTQIATIFLDQELRLRSFTPAVTRIYNLLPGDIGRPLAHTTHCAPAMPAVPDPRVLPLSTAPIEDEVQTTDGQSFIRRVLPYHRNDGRMEGIVMTFIDITELRRSELQFRGTFETAAVGMAHVALDGRWIRVNARLCQILRYSDAELRQTTVQDITHPEDLSRDLELLGQLVEGAIPSYTLDKRYRRKDGSFVWASLTVSLVRTHDGQPVYCIAVVQDISQAKAVEQALQESEFHFRQLIESLPQLIWSCRPSGECEFLSRQWCDYTGRSETSQLGYGWLDSVHPEDRQFVLEAWQQCVRAGQPFHRDFRIRGATGGYRWFKTRGVPVRHAGGHIVRWFGSNTDVEDQKEAEVALRRREQEFRTLAENSPSIIARFDSDLRYMYVNPAIEAATGIPAERYAGRLWREVGLPADAPEVWESNLRLALLGRHATTFMVQHQSPDGPRHFEARLVPESHQSREVQSVLAVCIDLTDRVQAHQDLQEARRLAEAANRSKSEFLANMSHEIRTPMTAILGYADVLLRHTRDPDDLQCLQTIRRNGIYLLEIINDILDLSKIEANKLELKLEDVSPSDVAAEVGALMEVRAREKHLALLVEFEGLLPETIDSDAVRLRQILINLLSNAIKFTERGSVRLQVELVHPAGPAIEFRVVDTGIGMSEEQIARLFKPFTQVDNSLTRKFGGTGLGLTITKRLVDMLGGTVLVRSEEQVGTQFRVQLPVREVRGLKRREPPPPAPSGPEDGAFPRLDCHVLVVDDRREVRHLSQHFIEDAGGTVTTAENGQEAIATVAAARTQGMSFDAVVIDMQMPVLDGYAAVQQLREHGYRGPIIALTAAAMQGDRERCLEAGCTDYTSKPIDRHHLVGLLARYTQSSAASATEVSS